VAVRRVLVLPDPGLKQQAKPVGTVDGEARALARDLLDTMRAAPACVGLAATQLGVATRAFALDVRGHRKARSCHGELVLFDPELLVAQEPEVGREGCLSVPDLTGDVARATRVVVEGLDVEGRRRALHCDAFEARAVLHELDHLDGHLFLDRLTAADRVFPRRVYR